MSKTTKRCPRCGEKCFIAQKKCDDCGLIFDRLKNLSNKEAKKAIYKKEKEKVIYVKEFPSDLKRRNVLLLSGFLGLFGAHSFYVGRYKKAVFTLITSLIAVVLSTMTVYTEFYDNFVEKFFFIPAGIVFFFWFYDFLMIAIKKYKVPAAIKNE